MVFITQVANALALQTALSSPQRNMGLGCSVRSVDTNTMVRQSIVTVEAQYKSGARDPVRLQYIVPVYLQQHIEIIIINKLHILHIDTNFTSPVRRKLGYYSSIVDR